MREYPAIALLELSSIASGVETCDSMVKRAPVAILKSGTVSKGRFLILIGGSVAAVEEAHAEGLAVGADSVLDSVVLPDVHDQIHDAVLGARRPCRGDGVAVCETRNVASTIRSADAAIKGAKVEIVEMRLADALGGKAFVVYTGRVEDLMVATEIARDSAQTPVEIIVVPKLHDAVAQQIEVTTRFSGPRNRPVPGR
jgi:microcompartment protein CcmL/EutN